MVSPWTSFAQGLSAPFHVLYHRYSQAFRLFWTVTDLNGLTLLMGKTLNKSGEWSQESLLYTSTQPLEDYKVSWTARATSTWSTL